jgi:DNA-binding transcriptional ArsR family regulator
VGAAEKLDETFIALADPTRRKVIELLRKKPQRAGDLAAAFDMVPPAMSRHLRVLRTSGLVEEGGLPEDARVRVYRLRAEPFAELRGWLDEIEAFWTDQLSAFKAHAEQTRAPSKRTRTRTRARRGATRRRTTQGGSR